MKIKFLIFTLICFVLASTSIGYAHHRIALLQKKINTVLYKKVTEELNLQGDKKDKVLKALQDTDSKKVILLDELMHLRDDLKKNEQNKNVSEVELAKQIEQIRHISQSIQALEGKKLSELRKVLSEEEVSKYIIIHHQMMDKIKSEVRKELKEDQKTH